MNHPHPERTIYLVGLIAALLAITALVGLPSLIGVVTLALSLTLAWRLGVLLDPYVTRVTILPEGEESNA